MMAENKTNRIKGGDKTTESRSELPCRFSRGSAARGHSAFRTRFVWKGSRRIPENPSMTDFSETAGSRRRMS